MKIELKPENMPVSKEMLDQATLSLKSDINRLEFKMDSKFDEIKSIVEAVKSDSASTRLLMEEQRNENRILYDHMNMMYDRQTHFEEKTDDNFLELRNLILKAQKN